MKNLAPQNTWETAIPFPEDGVDRRTAASIEVPYQKLLNRTEHLRQGGILRLRGVVSIAALKALTGMGDGEHVFVPSAGIYRYVHASTAGGDDVYVVVPSGGGGRWHLDFPAFSNRNLSVGSLSVDSAFRILKSAGDDVFLDAFANKTLNFQVGSGTKATITDVGNFGVAVTTPTERLHVNGNGLFNGNLMVTGSSHGTPRLIGDLDADASHIRLRAGNTPATQSWIGLRGNWNGVTNAGGFIDFATAGTERGRFTEVGSFLIGNTAVNLADVRLGVEGFATNTVAIGQLTGTHARQLLIGYDTANNRSQIQSIEQGVEYRPLLLNPNGGNIGVGTLTAEDKFHVHGGYIRSSGAGGMGFLLRRDLTDNADRRNWLISNELAGYGDFGIAASDSPTSAPDTVNGIKLLINRFGNVGISITDPVLPLDVREVIRARSSDGGNHGLEMVSSGGQSHISSLNRASGQLLPLTIYGSQISLTGGWVGVGTPAPEELLHVGSPGLDADQFIKVIGAGVGRDYGLKIGSHRLQSNTSASQRLCLDLVSGGLFAINGGPVGVGTPSPMRTFHVSGTDGVSLMLSNMSLAAGYKHWAFTPIGGDLRLQHVDDAGVVSYSPVTFTRSGRLGLGTGDPTAPLHVDGSHSGTYLKLGRGSGGAANFGDEVSIDFVGMNEVNQVSGYPAARIASYLHGGGNWYGMKFYNRTGSESPGLQEFMRVVGTRVIFNSARGGDPFAKLSIEGYGLEETALGFKDHAAPVNAKIWRIEPAGGKLHFTRYTDDLSPLAALMLQNDGSALVNTTTDDGTGAKLQVSGEISELGLRLADRYAAKAGNGTQSFAAHSFNEGGVWLENKYAFKSGSTAQDFTAKDLYEGSTKLSDKYAAKQAAPRAWAYRSSGGSVHAYGVTVTREGTGDFKFTFPAGNKPPHANYVAVVAPDAGYNVEYSLIARTGDYFEILMRLTTDGSPADAAVQVVFHW